MRYILRKFSLFQITKDIEQSVTFSKLWLETYRSFYVSNTIPEVKIETRDIISLIRCGKIFVLGGRYTEAARAYFYVCQGCMQRKNIEILEENMPKLAFTFLKSMKSSNRLEVEEEMHILAFLEAYGQCNMNSFIFCDVCGKNQIKMICNTCERRKYCSKNCKRIDALEVFILFLIINY